MRRAQNCHAKAFSWRLLVLATHHEAFSGVSGVLVKSQSGKHAGGLAEGFNVMLRAHSVPVRGSRRLQKK